MNRKTRNKTGTRQRMIRQAVILAGGQGTRLAPFTHSLPKPLMPVGEIPIIEILVRGLVRGGIREVIVALGHGAKLIQLFLGDGSQFGLQIRYVREKNPLGTAGPLRKISGLEENFLVLNGDLLTDIDFREFGRHHLSSGELCTVAICRRRVKADFGVVSTSDGRVTGYREKPTSFIDVSMGVYAFSREIIHYIPSKRFDFPDLMSKLLRASKFPVFYRFQGVWLDIGRAEDWARADKVFRRHTSKFV